ncbi:hypothetical protein TraAM80_09183 [Trypanosoma rangeli]|uniref:Uncharacterized protein n=1 Tax=Trypanosoma rangeli TaxID=5698 RepID=A0A3R7MZN7_TRYRA|nr:uncharacterized protein TraAM80_09176 [Trypanosoma rangeli]XP_029234260.1 uncharacterized protein TraAM80_09183 [Trypanosoma rangeli]RNE97692.1 hypothetical protein TraAM80_09176 [Trypanosoma rangeli]RNE97698.1 hypothetical protein TraAM80_09183 [Trypanosoma rangeli]|eukprot:RNE97692.1 hypothetical protein TraAM80_09176 [Trypanosoma rangeli]
MGSACLPVSGRKGRHARVLPAELLRWNEAADTQLPHKAALLIRADASSLQRARVGCVTVVAQLLPCGAGFPDSRNAFDTYFAAAAAQREKRVAENAMGRRRGARD